MIKEEETFKRFGYYARDLKQKSAKRIVAVCDNCGKVRAVRKDSYRALCISCRKGGREKRICQTCGIEFPVILSRIKQGEGKFCSPECKGKWQSKHQRGMNNPNWKGGKIKRVCETCGTEFPLLPSRIKQGEGKFCSPKCYAKWVSKRQKGKNNPNWQNGASFEPYCEKFNYPFKEYIRNKFNRICFLCPTTEEENGQRLSVHHVNYDKSCMCNDNLFFLFLLASSFRCAEVAIPK